MFSDEQQILRELNKRRISILPKNDGTFDIRRLNYNHVQYKGENR